MMERTSPGRMRPIGGVLLTNGWDRHMRRRAAGKFDLDYDEMIELVGAVKRAHRLKVAAVSNEGRELTVHRIRTFNLDEVIDLFISSCFVHFRKPDADIFRVALDVAQAPPSEVVYIEDRPLFVEVAGTRGIRGIHHTGVESTRAALAGMGLAVAEGDKGGRGEREKGGVV